MSSGYEQHKQLSAGKGPLPFAVLTLSDSRTPETDDSGKAIRALLEGAGHRVAYYTVVKDEPTEVRSHLQECLADPEVAIVITNGSTGVSKRDCAYETVSAMLEKRLDGFGELFRMLSWEQIGAGAMMSRAVAGIAGGKVVFAMPGSPKAVRLAMEKLILPEAAHLYWEVNR